MTTHIPLQNYHFFKGMAPAHLKLMSDGATPTDFKAGQFIFREGEHADRLYLIHHGVVALQTTIPGRKPITIQTLSTGDILGWSWLFPPYQWHFDALAIQDIHAVVFDAQYLHQYCKSDQDFGYEIMKRVSEMVIQRLQATRLQIMDIYGHQK